MPLSIHPTRPRHAVPLQLAAASCSSPPGRPSAPRNPSAPPTRGVQLLVGVVLEEAVLVKEGVHHAGKHLLLARRAAALQPAQQLHQLRHAHLAWRAGGGGSKQSVRFRRRPAWAAPHAAGGAQQVCATDRTPAGGCHTNSTGQPAALSALPPPCSASRHHRPGRAARAALPAGARRPPAARCAPAYARWKYALASPSMSAANASSPCVSPTTPASCGCCCSAAVCTTLKACRAGGRGGRRSAPLRLLSRPVLNEGRNQL